MDSTKNAGIWMDYSTAHVIDATDFKTEIIASKFSPDIRKEVVKKGEKHLHNKEQQLQEAYFKQISDKIMGYDKVLLFGPENAKTELQHYLSNESRFNHITVAVESTDKMTENEKKAFVRMHFNFRSNGNLA
ncbi:hypothetical protein [Fluviicola sp.]|uniref:hypothetical protein n=1 Tax=Fluviicola sp. TaxID=1917219 RepID=UPI0031E0F7E4